MCGRLLWLTGKKLLCQGSLSKGDLSNRAVTDHCFHSVPPTMHTRNLSCTLDWTHKHTAVGCTRTHLKIQLGPCYADCYLGRCCPSYAMWLTRTQLVDCRQIHTPPYQSQLYSRLCTQAYTTVGCTHLKKNWVLALQVAIWGGGDFLYGMWFTCMQLVDYKQTLCLAQTRYELRLRVIQPLIQVHLYTHIIKPHNFMCSP